jgi:hypothetical protein
MSGSVKPPKDDPHRLTQSLLPSYVTGRLEPAERAEVEAHLSGCAACRADERLERRLEAELAALPITVERGWPRKRHREPEPPSRPDKSGLFSQLAASWRAAVAEAPGAPGPKGWAMAAQAMAMIILVGLSWLILQPLPRPEARHAALVAPPPPSRDDILVTFRPETTERALRALLADNGARIVDGPTASGAFVIQAPSGHRPAFVERLRGRPEIALVEPIGQAAPP